MHHVLLAGGDTDTNAAIVGGVMRAYHGIDGIDSPWVDAVMDYDNTKNGPKRPNWLLPKYKM